MENTDPAFCFPTDRYECMAVGSTGPKCFQKVLPSHVDLYAIVVGATMVSLE